MPKYDKELSIIHPCLADLFLVDENPLENFKFLYPTGVIDLRDGQRIYRGGIKWTIMDGIVYHAPTLLGEVKKIISNARTNWQNNSLN